MRFGECRRTPSKSGNSPCDLHLARPVGSVVRRALASARWLLAALVLTTACSNPALRRTADVGPVRVTVGTIESSRPVTSLERSEGPIPEQLEDLFDLFWVAGCAGEQLRLTSRSDVGYPAVLCSLPGRSKSLIVVVAYIDLDPADSEVVDDWASAASLPTLYRSLGTEVRAHTFVFAGFGEASLESTWRSIRRLADAADAEVHAVVDLRRLLSGHHDIWYYASDPRLRDDLFTVGLAVGRSPDSLRLLSPPYQKRRSGRAARRLMGRIPAITIGTFAPGDAAGVASAPPDPDADDGVVLRLIAFFLGYIDQKFAVDPTPTEDLDSAESPRSIE